MLGVNSELICIFSEYDFLHEKIAFVRLSLSSNFNNINNEVNVFGHKYFFVLFSWPSISSSPSIPTTAFSSESFDSLPAAPDLNLPDPDVLVNQLGMLVSAAEGEAMNNEQPTSNPGLIAFYDIFLTKYCW